MSLKKLQKYLKKSTRGTPSISLRYAPKSRPTIFETFRTVRSRDELKSVSCDPAMSLAAMFDRSSDGYAFQSTGEVNALLFENGNLVSGRIDALIQHLVPTPHYHPDRTYIFAFLLSSRTYIQPHLLLKEVAQSCVYQLADNSVRKNKLGKFGPHVIKLLIEWTELFPYDYRDDRMMKHLRELTQKIVGFYPELRRDVSNMIHNLVNRLWNLQRYEDILSKLGTELAHKSQSSHTPMTDILEICTSPLHLAQQLTHIELERLSQIGPEEFIETLSQHYNNNNNNCQGSFPSKKKTTNLESYIHWFNHLSYFVATEICMHLKKKNRIKRINFFVDTAKECINLGNFNSVMAIVAGLTLNPVSRLKKTWDKVNLDKFRILEHQVDPSNNFSVYRSCLKAALWRAEGAVDDQERIVIPFFSLFLKDLYFVNKCCTDKLSEEYVNFSKFWQLAKQISEFMTWQHVLCPFQKNTEILHYILTAAVFTETTLSLASYECEMPENHFDKERRQTLKAQTKS